MRLPAKVSIVTCPVDETTALAVQSVAVDARVGAAPARAAGVGLGVQETAESAQAEMDVLRRPRKSWTPKWRITSAVATVEGMPSLRAIATAKLRRRSLQKTTST